jgi:hypothetical protein
LHVGNRGLTPGKTIKSHADYATSLTRDFAEPLHALPYVPSSATDRLEKTLKAYESAQSKIVKAQKKGGPKLLAAQQDAQDLQRQLEAQVVPEFVGVHQGTTMDRLQGLKELAVKWETGQSDMGNKRSEASQQGMMRVLGWEPEQQVSMLAIEKFGGVPLGSGQPRNMTSTPVRNTTIRRPTLPSDAGSTRSTEHASPSGGGFASTLKSKFGRKNSTMMTPSRGRTNSDAPPLRQQSTDIGGPPSTYATPLATPMMDAPRAGVDDDGFSVPPVDRGQAPWERQQQGRDLLDDDDEHQSGNGITGFANSVSPATESPPVPKFSSLALAPEPIQESESDREAALAKMQSTLLSSAPSGQGPSRRATLRARRDVRNTMFTALDRVEDEASLGEAVRAQKGDPFAAGGEGLRASFVESVSAVIKNGTVQRAMVTGEVSLTLKDPSVVTSVPLHIRLDAFEQLDKVAPNPRYLSQYPNTPGEYLLDLAALAQASTAGKGPTLFKYQVHIGDGRAGEWTPLEITPQWKPMAGESRLVLGYHANASSRLAQRDPAAVITDLTLTVTLGGANVTTVQAKPPGGTWSPEARAITWTLPDVDFSPSSAPGKIVARFITEGEAPAVPEPVLASFRVEGSLSTALGVSVVDEKAGWTFESVKRAVVSGKYVAE